MGNPRTLAWAVNVRTKTGAETAHVFVRWNGNPQESIEPGGWSIDGLDITCSACGELFVTVPLDEWVEIQHGCEQMQPILTRNLHLYAPAGWDEAHAPGKGVGQ